ncbi:MAG TPA: hypothetical protein VGJ86_16140 [Acidimicrobiales bacterium]
MRTTVCAVLAASILLASGCGDDDDDNSADPYVDVIATSLGDEQNGFALDDTQAKCAATAIVDAVGVKTLKDADVSATEFGEAADLQSLDVELSASAQEKLTKAFEDCDIATRFEEQLVKSFASNSGAEFTAEEASCVTEKLDDRAALGALVSGFVDTSRYQETLRPMFLGAVTGCPDALAEVMVATLGAPADAKDCVNTYVSANTRAVSDALNSDDSASLDAVKEAIRAACPTVPASQPTG